MAPVAAVDVPELAATQGFGAQQRPRSPTVEGSESEDHGPRRNLARTIARGQAGDVDLPRAGIEHQLLWIGVWITREQQRHRSPHARPAVGRVDAVAGVVVEAHLLPDVATTSRHATGVRTARLRVTCPPSVRQAHFPAGGSDRADFEPLEPGT